MEKCFQSLEIKYPQFGLEAYFPGRSLHFEKVVSITPKIRPQDKNFYFGEFLNKEPQTSLEASLLPYRSQLCHLLNGSTLAATSALSVLSNAILRQSSLSQEEAQFVRAFINKTEIALAATIEKPEKRISFCKERNIPEAFLNEGLQKTFAQRLMDFRKHADISIIPDALLKKIIDEYARGFRQHEEKLQACFDIVKETFLASLKEALLEKRLPAMDFSKAQQLINKCEIRLFDLPTSLIQRCTLMGKRFKGSDLVAVRSGLSEKDTALVLLHEFTHLISGKTNQKMTMSRANLPIQETEGEIRSGLLFSSPLLSPLGNSQEWFSWLDEALTIKAHDIIMQALTRGVYEEELALLEHLMHNGKEPLELKLFLAAYFESWSRESGIPNWHMLVNAIDKSFGPRYLQKLDKLVGRVGAQEALALAKTQHL